MIKKADDKKRALLNFANQFTDDIFPDNSAAKERVNKIIMKRAEEMSKYLNKDELSKFGAVMTDRRNGYVNGIRDKRILVTDDFGSLTLDKLSLKPNIFAQKPLDAETGRKNIFTAFTNLQEKVYSNIRKQPNMGDDNPVMKKAYVTRFVNGVKRQAQSYNLEDPLAGLYDRHDEYIIHTKFQHDSDEFKEMLEAVKAIHTFEKTGIIKYVKNDEEKEMNIFNISAEGQGGVGMEALNDASETVKKMYMNAQDKVNKYIDAKKGRFFGPLSKIGGRRFEAAKQVQRKIDDAVRLVNKLVSHDPVKETYEAFDKEPERKVKTRINANNLAIEERENVPQENNRVKDSAAKDANKAKGKADDKKKDEKGKGGKNK